MCQVVWGKAVVIDIKIDIIRDVQKVRNINIAYIFCIGFS